MFCRNALRGLFRHEQHTRLSRSLGRHRKELLMNSAEHQRAVHEMKELVTYAEIPAPDPGRGMVGFWKTGHLLKDVPNAFRCPQTALPLCFSTDTPEEKGFIPEIRKTGVPKLIKVEKDLQDFDDLHPPKNLNVYSGSYLKSRYLAEKKAKLADRIENIEPHMPDYTDLIVIGKNIENFRSGGKQVAPEVVLNDENWQSCQQPETHMLLLQINDVVMGCECSDRSHCEINHFTWEMIFETRPRTKRIKYLRLHNLGTVTLNYSWNRNDRPYRDPLFVEHKHESKFFFNKNESLLVPGEVVWFPIWFYSDKRGIAQECWEIVLKPPITCGASKMLIRLFGVAEEDYDWDALREIDADLDNRVSRRIARHTAERMARNVASPVPPEPPYDELFGERDHFAQVNRFYRYEPDAVARLRRLHVKLAMRTYSAIQIVQKEEAGSPEKGDEKQKKGKGKGKGKKEKKEKKTGKKEKGSVKSSKTSAQKSLDKTPAAPQASPHPTSSQRSGVSREYTSEEDMEWEEDEMLQQLEPWDLRVESLRDAVVAIEPPDQRIKYAEQFRNTVKVLETADDYKERDFRYSQVYAMLCNFANKIDESAIYLKKVIMPKPKVRKVSLVKEGNNRRSSKNKSLESLDSLGSDGKPKQKKRRNSRRDSKRPSKDPSIKETSIQSVETPGSISITTQSDIENIKRYREALFVRVYQDFSKTVETISAYLDSCHLLTGRARIEGNRNPQIPPQPCYHSIVRPLHTTAIAQDGRCPYGKVKLEYSYDENSPIGPSKWKDIAPASTGTRQSPVSIKAENLRRAIFTMPLRWEHYEFEPSSSILVNDGHSVIYRGIWPETQAPTITDGPLAKGTYVFDQLHFHWGSTNERGSEHVVNNVQYPMEMHVVHYKKDYGSYNLAIKYADGLAIVGCMYEIGDPQLVASGLHHLINGFDKVLKPMKESPVTPVPVSTIIGPFSDNYITYSGSLTSPPCNECVLWILPLKPLYITPLQMNKFRELQSKHGGPISDNFRSCQPLFGRHLYYVSAGVSGAKKIDHSAEKDEKEKYIERVPVIVEEYPFQLSSEKSPEASAREDYDTAGKSSSESKASLASGRKRSSGMGGTITIQTSVVKSKPTLSEYPANNDKAYSAVQISSPVISGEAAVSNALANAQEGSTMVATSPSNAADGSKEISEKTESAQDSEMQPGRTTSELAAAALSNTAAGKKPCTHVKHAAFSNKSQFLFSYNEKDPNGPSKWKNFDPASAGMRQSPIAISTQDYKETRTDELLEWSDYERLPASVMIQNNGYSIELTGKWSESHKPCITGGILGLLGPSPYVFEKLNFHWGTTDDSGSEHLVDGVQYPMEAQLVHYKQDYGSFDAALRYPDGLAVVGYLYQIGDDLDANKNRNGLSRLIEKFNLVESPGPCVPISAVSLSTIVPTFVDNYIGYAGSLTTPPCSEAAIWLLSLKPITVTREQIKAFRQLLSHRGPISGNFRPLQMTHGRSLLFVPPKTCAYAETNLENYREQPPVDKLAKNITNKN